MQYITINNSKSQHTIYHTYMHEVTRNLCRSGHNNNICSNNKLNNATTIILKPINADKCTVLIAILRAILLAFEFYVPFYWHLSSKLTVPDFHLQHLFCSVVFAASFIPPPCLTLLRRFFLSACTLALLFINTHRDSKIN